tara:strand:- start:7284 stop:7559 length:276 start_codon:yes stop_codon:yes gene_type:complete
MIKERTISVLRQKIDQLDDQLTDILLERFDLCNRIGNSKSEIGAQTEDEDREREIIDRIAAQIDGKLSLEEIKAIFLPIFQISRNLQHEEK